MVTGDTSGFPAIVIDVIAGARDGPFIFDRRLEVGEVGVGGRAIVVVNEANVRTDYRTLYIATATRSPLIVLGKS